MDQGETLPPKKDVARALLLRGSVFVYLDPRKSSVRVPTWFAQQPQLVLQIGLDLLVPIPDLRVDDHGVFGTLSLNRSPFTCTVPWSAVFALVGDDGMGMVWPEDMPGEIASDVERGAQREPEKKQRLRAIGGGVNDAEERSAEKRTASERPRERYAESVPAEAVRDADVSGGYPSAERQRTAEQESAPHDAEGRRKLPPYLRVIK